MSLDYDLRNIKDRSVNFPPETDPAVIRLAGDMNRKVYSVIWSTIAVQIGTITEDNADEFYDRYSYWNRLMFGPDEELPFTREDVHLLVGLSTNVFPDLTHEEWLDRLFRFHKEGRL